MSKKTTLKASPKVAARTADGGKQTRIHVAAVTVTAIRKPTATADLVKAADAAYKAQGGKSNPRESAWACGRVLDALEAVGLIRREGDVCTVVGRVVSK